MTADFVDLFRPAPSTATTVTSVSPIISAAAVEAVRDGLRDGVRAGQLAGDAAGTARRPADERAPAA